MTIKLETEEGGRPTTQFLQVASLMPRAVEGAGSEPVAVGGGRGGDDPVMPAARCLMLAAHTALRIALAPCL